MDVSYGGPVPRNEMPEWARETADEIESGNHEEQYFCKLCGFSVIMPMQADVHYSFECGEGLSSTVIRSVVVGLAEHLPNPCSAIRRMSCPFHPEIELTKTAYKREAAVG